MWPVVWCMISWPTRFSNVVATDRWLCRLSIRKGQKVLYSHEEKEAEMDEVNIVQA